MTQEQALGVLIQAVQLAQTKGAFNLQEAKMLAEAVDMFTKKPEEKVEEVKEEVEEVND